MKLKVKERFYDKRENNYVEKDEVIEREETRAQELIDAGVAVLFEGDEEDEKPEDEKTEVQEETAGDDQAPVEEEAPAEEPEDEKPEKGKKKKNTK